MSGNITLLISIVSLLISFFTLGWTVYRDFIDNPKLKLKIFISDVCISSKIQTSVISISITNIGKRPIIIKGHGLYLNNSDKFIIRDVISSFIGKKLEPYEYLEVTLSNDVLKELAIKANELKSFVVYDTTGKEWSVDKKQMLDLTNSLIKKR